MTSTTTSPTREARIAKALAHPLRARMLELLGEQTLSPADLATQTGAPLGVVAYHVRMLRDYECVELVRTEPRRGALQHFYRATVNAPRVETGEHPLRELHRMLFPERYDPDADMYQWHAGTIEDIAAAIERLAGEHGVELTPQRL